MRPELSDNCRGEWGISRDEADRAAKNVKTFTVRFTRKFGHIFSLIARPCGFIFHVHLALESEGPKEDFGSGDTCFGPHAAGKASVFLFDATCLITPLLVSRNKKHRYRLPGWDRTLFFVPYLHQKSHKVSHAW